MIRQIAPQFFTMDLAATLAYYKDKLGFECLGTWQDPAALAFYRDHLGLRGFELRDADGYVLFFGRPRS